MASTNQDLLDLEQQPDNSLESRLLFCNKGSSCNSGSNPPIRRPGDKLVTTPLPKSQVMGKVKDFLSVMAEANEKLKQDVQVMPPDTFNIEVLSGRESQYIELDLSLGVVDLYTPEALAAAESVVAGSKSLSLDVTAKSDSSSDSEAESDLDELVVVDPTKPSNSPAAGDESKESSRKKRKRLNIIELS